ncbi:hypothetical protein L202_05583 [Cryptococcus amylolentus CBS 6039]|uniref:Uncharacterized protein n=2 Tax=Cryptococcus amylolentus TaxID=104669 RepID=A0A1E3HNL4_9TREE|nr:hypothetical protein L202_05583 [Cryptococcus amylolentus CBS 6039]ODN77041.1 hypothetical protein L202_05583 [Cryptococcus amylolentus CBS 6039]ODO04901.1 hypothetical protein I350_05511 [Cryptococcus amylolentus CBS 6273]
MASQQPSTDSNINASHRRSSFPSLPAASHSPLSNWQEDTKHELADLESGLYDRSLEGVDGHPSQPEAAYDPSRPRKYEDVDTRAPSETAPSQYDRFPLGAPPPYESQTRSYEPEYDEEAFEQYRDDTRPSRQIDSWKYAKSAAWALGLTSLGVAAVVVSIKNKSTGGDDNGDSGSQN